MELSNKRTYYQNNLRAFREMAGFTQQEVSILIGLASSNRISLWESGQSMPSVENLFKLSVLYKRLPDDLYNELRKRITVEIQTIKNTMT